MNLDQYKGSENLDDLFSQDKAARVVPDGKKKATPVGAGDPGTRLEDPAAGRDGDDAGSNREGTKDPAVETSRHEAIRTGSTGHSAATATEYLDAAPGVLAEQRSMGEDPATLVDRIIRYGRDVGLALTPDVQDASPTKEPEDASGGEDAEVLPTLHISQIPPAPAEARWLVENLWTGRGVGIIGGHPKVGKSWLGLEIAVAVASGTPCLGHFPVVDPGPVLVFLAEDNAAAVRARIEGICVHRGLDFDALPISIVDRAVVRLDSPADQRHLRNTIARMRPRLLVLDPLVRLHSGNENSAQTIAGVLGYLREVQRSYGVAIILAHHLSKRATSHPGQALRGSGDLHAWGDSNLYVERREKFIMVTPEHRSEPADDPFYLRLEATEDGAQTHLEVVDDAVVEAAAAPAPAVSLAARIIAALEEAAGPMTRDALREHLHVKNESLVRALAELQKEGRIVRERRGWTLVADVADDGEATAGAASD